MTRTEREIIKKLNDFGTQGKAEDFLVPKDLGGGLTMIPTFPFAMLMMDKDSEIVQQYHGPNIESFIQFDNSREIYSAAFCSMEFTEEQKKIVQEYSFQLEQIGEELMVEDTPEGTYIECGAGIASDEDGWQDRFLKDLDDEQTLESMYFMLVFSPCFKMMDHVITIQAILAGEMTVEEAVEIARNVFEEE